MARLRTEDLLDHSDLFEAAGSFNPHRANELLDVIKESRKEWAE